MPTGVYLRKPFSEEHKKNISLSKRKENHPMWKGGKPHCTDCGKRILSGYDRKRCWTCFKRLTFGKGNHFWKGDKVKYSGLHMWIRRNLGKPDTCEKCGIKATGHKMHWSNKSGLYLRDFNDWQRLCAKCHKEYDMRRISYAP